MPLNNPRNRFIAVATGTYLIFALVWIFLSDQLLERFTDVSSLIWLSTAKGLFFVLSTAGLFFVALHAVPQLTRADETLDMGSLDQGLGLLQVPRWMVYVFALLVTALMVAVRESIAQGQNDRPMLVLFMLPIIVSALIGGLGPGLLSTTVATVGAYWVILVPRGTVDGLDQVQFAALIANGVAISVLSAVLRHALRRANNQRRLLNSVVSGTSDAVFVKDQVGRYLLVNQAAAQFIGKPLSEILGHNDSALFDRATAEDVIARDKAIMEGGTTQTSQESLKTLTGKEVVFLVSKGPMRDADGAVSGVFGIARDITEREKAKNMLHAREQQLARVIEGSDQGFWDWNLKTNHFEVTPRWETMLGFEAGKMDVSLTNWGAMVHPDDWVAATASIERHIAGQTDKHEIDLRCRTKSGDWRWIHTRGRVVE